MISISAEAFFFSFFKLAFVGVILCNEVSLSLKFILVEIADIIVSCIPLVYSLPLFHSLYKLAFIK